MRDIFRANITSKLELSEEEKKQTNVRSITVRYIGMVNVNNHELLSRTSSQTSESAPNPPLKFS